MNEDRPSSGGKRPRRCPRCGSADLLEVELSVNGEPVAFTSCHHCETKWWEREGDPLPLESVLDAVSRR